MKPSKSLINWQNVRNIGELQVLTRASYLMLILVPVMAAIWPGIRIVLNNYNQAITDAHYAMDIASEKLQIQVIRSEQIAESDDGIKHQLAEQVGEILSNLDGRLNEVIADYSLKTIKKTSLPNVWVWTFLASLLVLLAHLVYQSRAPDIVRNYKLEEYAISRRNMYAENPSKGFLGRADSFFRKAKDKGIYQGIDPENFLGQSSLDVNDSNDQLSKELDFVEAGASLEYLYLSHLNRIAANISGTIYILALVILGYIALSQTWFVLRAAEWFGIA